MQVYEVEIQQLLAGSVTELESDVVLFGDETPLDVNDDVL